MNHTLDLKIMPAGDFIYAMSSGGNISKTLRVCVAKGKISYVVTRNGDIMINTHLWRSAVRVYNAIGGIKNENQES